MKRIMIAEDDPVMARLLEFNLKKAGFILTICRDGGQVVERAREFKPDVALFDLNLPGKSGLELSREFQADSELCGIPRIIVTAQGKASVFDDLYEAGVKRVFTKPFSPSALVVAIHELTDTESAQEIH